MYVTLRLNINSLSSSQILTTFGRMFFQRLQNEIQDYILNWQLHTVACRRYRHRNKDSITGLRETSAQCSHRPVPAYPCQSAALVLITRIWRSTAAAVRDETGNRQRAVIISRPTNGTVQCSGKYR